MQKKDFLTKRIVHIAGLLAFLLSNSQALADNRCSYITLDAGASLALSPRLNVPPPWDFSPNGYNNKFRNSEVLGAGLGFSFCPGLATEIVAHYRNDYKYTKNQTSSSPLGDKIRYFNLTNTTVMANVLAYGRLLSDCLAYEAGYFMIEPYINAGFGLSYNTLSNFHSLQLSGGSTVFSVMQPYTQTSVAYQFGFGLEFLNCDPVSLGIGYRFVSAGRFRTNDYLVDNPDAAVTSGVSQPFWRGTLRANEIYLKFKLQF